MKTASNKPFLSCNLPAVKTPLPLQHLLHPLFCPLFICHKYCIIKKIQQIKLGKKIVKKVWFWKMKKRQNKLFSRLNSFYPYFQKLHIKKNHLTWLKEWDWINSCNSFSTITGLVKNDNRNNCNLNISFTCSISLTFK